MPCPGGRTRIVALAVLAAVAVAAALVFAAARRRPAAPLVERPAEFVTDFERAEAAADAAAKSLKATFVKGLREGNDALVAAALAEDFLARFPDPGDGEAVPDGTLSLRRYGPAAPRDLDRGAFLATLGAHVRHWSVVERAAWRTFEFLLDPAGRRAAARVHFQLAGRRPPAGRADIQATLALDLVLEPVNQSLAADGSAWRIRRLEWVEGTRAESERPAFADVTDATGFHFNESEENRTNAQALVDERRTLTSGGLTVLDWNRDGFWDILATAAKRQAVLFLNDGKGGFVRAPSPFGGEDPGHACLYVDLDGDGQEELVGSRILSYEGTRASAGIYTRRNGEWVLLPHALSFDVPAGLREIDVQAIVPYDVDGNGFIDLFFCAYGDSRSKRERYNRVEAHDGARNLLFMNQGGLRFAEESEARGIHGTQYTYVAAFFDFDFDGDADIFEGNDFGPNILWENRGDGTFRKAADHPLSAGSNFSMGVTIADYDNSGAWAIHVSNMYSHAGNRLVPLAAALRDGTRARLMTMASGNQQYERDPARRTWRECAVERGVNIADWAWAALFCDLDNDGDKDLFVVNGFTSHRDAAAPDY